ncbi:MAG TPA: septum formation initiator family protein [Hyphomicrobiales bacterium]|nr:septum formation initiator family protein [Kaistiaceae bacterium]HQF30377.1 septum formation initiator family protein [Hyphomicrobiales bacterium]
MTTRQKRRSGLGKIILPATTIACLGYFAYHAFHGEYGIFARDELAVEIARVEAERDGLEARRQELEKRVALMKPTSLDPDMIDERARMSLNLAGPDEIVILERQ